ncbi:MAG: pectate lyase [Candidatus Hydrogenedentota bacterium]
MSIFSQCARVATGVALVSGALVPTAAVSEEPESPLEAVRTFADTVLEKGEDRWSGEETPLLPDGVNVDTGEPVEWIYDGDHFIIHNLASQQNLFRTLAGLTNLTGEERYRAAAEEAIEYHFDELRSERGLLRWGGHQIIDLATLEPVGHFDADCHEFKNHFPYYELMADVDSEATVEFLRAFWNAHIMDWERLDMNRHGPYGKEMGDLWDNEFEQPEPFFEGRGLTFINCGSDLIYAGGMLYLLNDEEGALTWGKRLAEQYVRARHPETGLGVYQYSKPEQREEPPETGPLEGRLTYSTYGDRAMNQFGDEFGDVAREGWVLWGYQPRGIYVSNALIQLELAERLGEQGEELLEWTTDGMKAYIEHAYEPGENQFRPMWADGTDLTGHVIQRTGYHGSEGTEITPRAADGGFLFSYSRAYRLTGDPVLWEAVRSMAQGLDLGDFGSAPGEDVDVNLDTSRSDPNALFAILEISQTADEPAYLELAEAIGDNIIGERYHDGFFLPSSNHINAKFDAVEPLALLSLEAALRGDPGAVPVYSGGSGYLHARFDGMGRTRDGNAIWSQTRD